MPACGASAAATAGAAALYSDLVWPASKSLRQQLLKGLVRPFKAAVSSIHSSAKVDGRFLTFLAALAFALPLRRSDEACLLLREASALVATHGQDALSDLRAAVKHEQV